MNWWLLATGVALWVLAELISRQAMRKRRESADKLIQILNKAIDKL